jgi:hypothetical protein
MGRRPLRPGTSRLRPAGHGPIAGSRARRRGRAQRHVPTQAAQCRGEPERGQAAWRAASRAVPAQEPVDGLDVISPPVQLPPESDVLDQRPRQMTGVQLGCDLAEPPDPGEGARVNRHGSAVLRPDVLRDQVRQPAAGQLRPPSTRRGSRQVIALAEQRALFVRTGHHSAHTGEFRDAAGAVAALFPQR